MEVGDKSDCMLALITAIRHFNSERDWEQYHTPKNLAMALSAEAAEIVELFQWLTPEQSRQLTEQKLSQLEQEIGDVLIYLLTLSDKFSIDPIDAATKKLESNAQKYPSGQVRGKSNKYNEY